jgi:hypothetical protein
MVPWHLGKHITFTYRSRLASSTPAYKHCATLVMAVAYFLHVCLVVSGQRFVVFYIY